MSLSNLVGVIHRPRFPVFFGYRCYVDIAYDFCFECVFAARFFIGALLAVCACADEQGQQGECFQEFDDAIVAEPDFFAVFWHVREPTVIAEQAHVEYPSVVRVVHLTVVWCHGPTSVTYMETVAWVILWIVHVCTVSF